MCGAGVHYCVDPGLADLISSYGPIRGPHQVFPIREVYLNGHTTHRFVSLTNHGVPLLDRSHGRLTQSRSQSTEEAIINSPPKMQSAAIPSASPMHPNSA